MALPGGVVTLLFTDIEGSTALLKRTGERYADLLERHRQIVRAAVAAEDGTELGTEGDSFVVAFRDARPGLAAAVAAQLGLAAEPWPSDGVVRVRMGLHSGPVARAADNYVGITVHEAARIADAARGGQIVCSDATAISTTGLPDDVTLQSLGPHRLRDIDDEIDIHQVCHPSLEATFPALRSVVSTTGSVPVLPSTFVGRSAELAALRILLRSRRLLSIVGPPGVGKTRLAIELARAEAGAWRAGARLAELAGVERGDGVPAEVAGALGVRDPGGRSVTASIEGHLARSDVCLVVDNCDHVVDAVADLASRILTTCPDVRLLVTSREPLEIDGETVWQLAPLEEAPELFVNRAATARPDLVLSADDPTVREICARIDGLPLAIELAAAQVRRQTVGEIASDLAGRFALLDRSMRGSAKRHATLRAAIEWSYSQLDPPHATLLDQLSVFPSGFDAEAAAAITGARDAGALLGGLVDRSLISAALDGERTRYQLLSTIRAAARDHLDETSERSRLAAAHARHFRAKAARFRATAAGLIGAFAQPELLDVAARDIDDHRAALGWYRERDPADGLSYVIDLDVLWWARLDAIEGAELLDGFLRAAPEAPTGVRATALTVLADLCRLQGRFAEAKRLAEKAVGLDPRAGADRGMASGRFVLASVLAMQGELEPAEELFAATLADALASGDEVDASVARRGLVALAIERCDAVAARAAVDDAITEAERVGNPWSLGALQRLEAGVLMLEGRLEEARQQLEGLVPGAQDAGLNAVAEVSRSLATALRLEGSYAQALELLAEAGRIFDAQDDLGGLAHVLAETGVVRGLLGEHGEAVAKLDAALAMRQGVGLVTPGSEVADIERTREVARAALGG